MLIKTLKSDIERCTVCEAHLPLGPRPVTQFSASSKILLVGQAPGRRVHETGLPFNDPSGDRLREWLGVNRNDFYDEKKFAIVPMGFCYPGTGKSGDLPPRKECAETWREKILMELKNIKLTVVIGRYALDYHLPETKKLTVTKAVQNWQDSWPDIIPLPHPSPRNNRWLRNNPWFEAKVVPELQASVLSILSSD